MSISADTWAVVLATGVGPIAAVGLSLWREARNSLKSRQLWVFRTLMMTRRLGISADHVNALNLVEVDFYKCQKVLENWKTYKDHLFSNAPEDEVWYEKKERLLANLLFEMAAAQDLSIPAMEIFKGGYAPKGWAHIQSRQNAALEYVYELSQGSKIVPIWITGTTTQPPTEQTPQPNDGADDV
jgi:hypothetical protein